MKRVHDGPAAPVHSSRSTTTILVSQFPCYPRTACSHYSHIQHLVLAVYIGCWFLEVSVFFTSNYELLQLVRVKNDPTIYNDLCTC